MFILSINAIFFGNHRIVTAIPRPLSNYNSKIFDIQEPKRTNKKLDDAYTAFDLMKNYFYRENSTIASWNKIKEEVDKFDNNEDVNNIRHKSVLI